MNTKIDKFAIIRDFFRAMITRFDAHYDRENGFAANLQLFDILNIATSRKDRLSFTVIRYKEQKNNENSHLRRVACR